MPTGMIAPACAKVVPEWVKFLSAEGTALAEARRLQERGHGPVKPHSVMYWRLRARMFSPHSIFANKMLWGALREAILDATSPWEPKPWGKLLPDVIDDFGHVSEGTMRHALRMLVEDGVLQFTEPGDDEHGEYSYGGYTRERHPIRRSSDITWDSRDELSPAQARALRAGRALAPIDRRGAAACR